MQTNSLPRYDDSDNPTGCCPRFNPDGWDQRTLHFKDKAFIRATTVSAMHVPLNMGKVFTRVQEHLEENGAYDPENCIVLSRDLSPWQAEHLFSISNPVPEEEAVTLSGDFITKVFEGPYKDAPDWHEEMEALVREKGGLPARIYFFYTTCPKCAKAYEKNYVIGVAELN
ncbi:MAG: hypothetical protein JXR14_05060 [Paracoccaceae bacterium]